MAMFERKIDGHIFHVQSQHKTKSGADKEAEWLRKHGNKARVVSGKPWARHYGDNSIRYLVLTSKR